MKAIKLQNLNEPMNYAICQDFSRTAQNYFIRRDQFARKTGFAGSFSWRILLISTIKGGPRRLVSDFGQSARGSLTYEV